MSVITLEQETGAVSQKKDIGRRYIVRYPNGDLCSSYNLYPNKELAKQSAVAAGKRVAGHVFFQDEDRDAGKEVEIFDFSPKSS